MYGMGNGKELVQCSAFSESSYIIIRSATKFNIVKKIFNHLHVHNQQSINQWIKTLAPYRVLCYSVSVVESKSVIHFAKVISLCTNSRHNINCQSFLAGMHVLNIFLLICNTFFRIYLPTLYVSGQYFHTSLWIIFRLSYTVYISVNTE